MTFAANVYVTSQTDRDSTPNEIVAFRLTPPTDDRRLRRVATSPAQRTDARCQEAGSEHQLAASFLALIALILTVDARRNSLAPFDRPLIDAVQRVELPHLSTAVACVNAITNSTWAVVAWAVVLLTLLAIRWWIPALAVLVMPWGGFVNNLVGVHVVVRTRPDGNGLLRSVGDWDAPSFPSGHVMGAVMLYGFIIYLAPRICHDSIRRAVVAVSIAIIATVGFARLWIGAHWPSDVLAAYVLGGLVLVLLMMFIEQAEWTIASLTRRFHLPTWLSARTNRS